VNNVVHVPSISRCAAVPHIATRSGRESSFRAMAVTVNEAAIGNRCSATVSSTVRTVRRSGADQHPPEKKPASRLNRQRDSVVRVKLFLRFEAGPEYYWGSRHLTATEDYLPGAIGGPAFGYGLNTDTLSEKKTAPEKEPFSFHTFSDYFEN